MKKILIVDDMEVNREMTAFMLAEKYETVCASSAKEAAEVYRREKPDLILSDFRMPGMTGYDFQIALQNEFHKKIPFISTTEQWILFASPFSPKSSCGAWRISFKPSEKFKT